MPTRQTYAAIKDAVLHSYFRFSLCRGAKQNWPVDQVIGSVGYDFENAFDDELSQVMVGVVLLALSWHMTEPLKAQPRKLLLQQLAQPNIREAIDRLPEEERQELLADLADLSLGRS